MPTYKLLALDMDGTLLTSDKRISDRTSSALRRAAEAGITIVLSTGRAAVELLDYQPQLEGVVRYGTLLSGAVVWDFTEKRALETQFLDPESVRIVVAQGLAEDAMVQLFDRECAIMTRRDVARMPEIGQGVYQDLALRRGTFVDDIDTYARTHDHGLCKVNLHHVSRASMGATQRALGYLPLQLATGESASVEVTPPGVTKALGLKWLYTFLGINPEEAIVVGDGDNDLEAMGIAGLAVAMDNARPAVKACAHTIVADNDHDGIVDVIERWIEHT
ncbi:MAG: HAD hydrolase family protein [Atopobiaceae bacterium]|nr:HAD hydrolase family protein [Atopobiaceae bacterium]